MKVRHLPILLVSIVTLVGCGGDGDRRFLSLGTAGTGGVYYPLGGALAGMLSESLESTRVTAEVTGGSVENLNRVIAGQLDLAMAIGTTLARAEAATDGAPSAVRIVAPLYPNTAHVLVGAGSEIDSVAAAAGRRVSLGAAGSGTEQMARDVLAAHGVTVEEVDARYLTFTESSAALRDGAIDLAIFSVGYPASAVLEATATAGARLLPLDDAARAALAGEHPTYREAVIPAGVYPGIDEDVPTVAIRNWIFGREDLADEVVTAVLEILVNRRDELVAVSEIAGRIRIDSLADAPLPLHPAAAAWLQERQAQATDPPTR